MHTAEIDFEDAIERALVAQGYISRPHEEYDRDLCLDPKPLLDFIMATQPKEWQKLTQHHGAETKQRFVTRVSDEVRKQGVLKLLRGELREAGCRFRLAFFRPSSSLNPDLARLCEGNQFTVTRQLRYSTKGEHSLDLVLFLNGLPLFTAELKNPLTSQNVKHAMTQYRTDRDPKEPLFRFGRCLAHFAVDPDLVRMTTHLRGKKTFFLPFDRGRDGGAGNKPALMGYPTSYLWEEVWAPDSVLNLVQHFIQEFNDLDDRSNRTGSKTILFPRYHQLDCVRRLVADARATGTGHRYLIQHSAGSGKTYTISWLAHQLSVLHDDADEPVFDSVIVVTDRVVLDRQLQRAVRQFEQVLGVVENIDKTSRQLKQALEQGKKIIVTTLWKFPVIVEQISALPGSRFAVIIDEAHSSQSGEGRRHLNQVLSSNDLNAAEGLDAVESEDVEDKIIAIAQSRGALPNVSTFAFTATPKGKTLEAFGTQNKLGQFEPFSLYSMRQAIEEGFILDVLRNYTTYKSYWRLLKTLDEGTDPTYDRSKAAYLLTRFASLSEHAISQKVDIMLTHFTEHVVHQIGGKAKAMVVTRSRLHAVRYYQEIAKQIRERGLRFRALVAFSGRVSDGVSEFTEAGMNGFPETQTAERFRRDDCRIMVVAEKFQTGFDQPLLHTMYVDKRLGGVNAVQTLSRLNRTHPGKTETMVLDFTNDTDTIREAFEPYYEATVLSEATDPNTVYRLLQRVMDFHVCTEDEVHHFADRLLSGAKHENVMHLLAPPRDRFAELTEEEQSDFRATLKDFVRQYAFLSQIISFTDADLERLYWFAKSLLKVLPYEEGALPFGVEDQVDLESYVTRQTQGSTDISLGRGKGTLDPLTGAGRRGKSEADLEALSEIIRDLNERFGTELGDDAEGVLGQIEARLDESEAVAQSVRINPPENAKLTFRHVALDLLQDLVDTHFQFYRKVNDDPDLAQRLMDQLFDRYLARRTRPPEDV